MKAYRHTLIVLMALAASCSVETEEQLENRHKNPLIQFNVKETRSMMVSSEDFHDSFGVLGYSFIDNWSEEALPDLMYDIEVSKESSWTTSHHWPGGRWNVRFFAYAPYHGRGIELSGRDESGSPRLEYSVAPDVAAQEDLVVAASEDFRGDNGLPATLSFDHALTAISFVCGEDMEKGTIKNIAVKGAYSKGTYDFEDRNWHGQNDTCDFNIPLDIPVSGAGETITSGETTLLLLPQVLPEGARIEVVIDNGLSEHILSSSIAGSEWLAGTSIVYYISSTSINWSYTFEVSDIQMCTHEGGIIPLSVSSSRARSSNDTPAVPVGWTAEFVEENAAGEYYSIPVPDWLSGVPSQYEEDNITSGHSIGITPQMKITVNEADEALKNASEVTGVHDLSTDGGTSPARSANCYIVNAPGTYSLPLVYGNALDFVKGDANGDNKSSYHYVETNFTYLTCLLNDFINHLGAAISNPYISRNYGCRPHDAIVVWEDAAGLVSDPTVNGDNLVFEVRRKNIKQGNAVIAVRDESGTILWSWHIWVTDQVLGENTVTFHSEIYDTRVEILPVDLGWCDNGCEVYEERRVKVRFTQAESGLSIIREIVQKSDTLHLGGNSPYYQWGRKDPMQAAESSFSGKGKAIYDSSGALTDGLKTGSWSTEYLAIMNGILKPDVFNTYETENALYSNLWSIKSGVPHNVDLIKTVYDPCPVGFQVTNSLLARHFLLNGTERAANYSATWNESLNGYDLNGESGKTFIPTLGRRDARTGELTDVGTVGTYWSSFSSTTFLNQVPPSIISSYNELDPTFFSNGIQRNTGCTIRPQREL